MLDGKFWEWDKDQTMLSHNRMQVLVVLLSTIIDLKGNQ